MNGAEAASIILLAILIIVVAVASGLVMLGYTPTVGIGS